MEKLRIIIAGSRIFNNYSLLKESVTSLISGLNKEYHIEIISGGAKGADKLGELFAHEMKYEVNIFKADWDKLGRRAGYVRNKKMAEYASEKGYNGMLIAFWDGKSKGTKHMIDLGIKYSLNVNIVHF